VETSTLSGTRERALLQEPGERRREGLALEAERERLALVVLAPDLESALVTGNGLDAPPRNAARGALLVGHAAVAHADGGGAARPHPDGDAEDDGASREDPGRVGQRLHRQLANRLPNWPHTPAPRATEPITPSA